MARTRDFEARKRGREMMKPSEMLWTERARKTAKPRWGLTWLVAKVMKPCGAVSMGWIMCACARVCLPQVFCAMQLLDWSVVQYSEIRF